GVDAQDGATVQNVTSAMDKRTIPTDRDDQAVVVEVLGYAVPDRNDPKLDLVLLKRSTYRLQRLRMSLVLYEHGRNVNLRCEQHSLRLLEIGEAQLAGRAMEPGLLVENQRRLDLYHPQVAPTLENPWPVGKTWTG